MTSSPKPVVGNWVDGQIIFQRGYFDRLTFYKAAGIALEDIPA